MAQLAAPERSRSQRSREKSLTTREVYLCCNMRQRFYCGRFWKYFAALFILAVFSYGTAVLFGYRQSYYYAYGVGVNGDGTPTTFYAQLTRAIAEYAIYLRAGGEDQVSYLDNAKCGRGARVTMWDAIIYLSTEGDEDSNKRLDLRCDREFDDGTYGWYGPTADDDDDALQRTTAHIKCHNFTTLSPNVTDALECLFDGFFQEEGQHHCSSDMYGLLIAVFLF